MSTSVQIQSERTPLLPNGGPPRGSSGGSQPSPERQIVLNQTPVNPSTASTQLPTSNPTGPAPAKKVMVPLRVEPKVYFANERTFLSWLNFCVVLGGLALGLLNFGDRVGQISGVVFTIVAMIFMGYAVNLYRSRSSMIRRRDPGPYDDQTGPYVLCAVLFFAIGLNFYLKFTSPSNMIF